MLSIVPGIQQGLANVIIINIKHNFNEQPQLSYTAGSSAKMIQATLENGLPVSYKVKQRLTTQPSNPTTRYLPQVK